MRHLADVNVLLALLWPRHEAHAAAQIWFANSGHRAWATNPLTQLGVLRLLTNPVITQGAVSAVRAVDVLGEATRHPGHEFWPIDSDIPAALKDLSAGIRGHLQWTDAALLWHAAARNGVLVTFDSGIKELAPKDSSRHALVLKKD